MTALSFQHSFSPLLHPQQLGMLDFGQLVIHNRFRGHPELEPDDHILLFQHEIANALTSGGKCYAMLHGKTLQAICAVSPLSWDSQHFGKEMAKMTISCSHDLPTQSLRLLAEKTIDASVANSPAHISCEVDIDNYLCLNTLLSMGAEILDLKREYRAKSVKHLSTPKFMSKVRPYTLTDRNGVLEILNTSRFATRFSRDSTLSADRSKKLYLDWMEKILDRPDQERIALVVEKAGKIQACGTIEEQDLSPAGVDVQLMSGGIYVSRPDATGYYYPVLYGLINAALAHYQTAQTCISLNNHPAVRVMEKMNFGTESTRYALRLKV